MCHLSPQAVSPAPGALALSSLGVVVVYCGKDCFWVPAEAYVDRLASSLRFFFSSRAGAISRTDGSRCEEISYTFTHTNTPLIRMRFVSNALRRLVGSLVWGVLRIDDGVRRMALM